MKTRLWEQRWEPGTGLASAVAGGEMDENVSPRDNEYGLATKPQVPARWGVVVENHIEI